MEFDADLEAGGKAKPQAATLTGTVLHEGERHAPRLRLRLVLPSSLQAPALVISEGREEHALVM